MRRPRAGAAAAEQGFHGLQRPSVRTPRDIVIPPWNPVVFRRESVLRDSAPDNNGIQPDSAPRCP